LATAIFALTGQRIRALPLNKAIDFAQSPPFPRRDFG
jgi:hypothetical protein